MGSAEPLGEASEPAARAGEGGEGRIVPASATLKDPVPGEGPEKGKGPLAGSELPEGKPGEGKDSKEKKINSSEGGPMGHSFMRNRTPVESLYLVLKGAEGPDEPPEVYYKFTARTLERHGGVPLGSRFYKAKVEKDENGLWRADLIGKTFGTFEVYSRYKIKGSTFFSQFNILHFVTEDITEGPDAESVPGLPSDWPEYVFPSARQNKMPFRGMETESKVDFEIKRGGKPALAVNSYLLDAKDGPYAPAAITLKDASTGTYTFSPPKDPSLFVSAKTSGGRPMGRVGFKNMVAVLELPNNEFMTFTLTVSRSRWTYRKLGLGLVFVLTVSVIVGLVTAQRRRKFKYNEFD
jgi:hypothetical protein